MSRIAARLLALTLALPAAEAASDQAAPPPTEQVRGAVVSVSGTTVKLKMASGKVATYTLEAAASARAKELKPNWRVLVTVRRDEQGRAFIVAIGEASPPAPGQGTPGPGTDASSRRSHILVTTDLACDVSVDFKKVATLPAGGHTTLDVEPGERMITATAPGGASKNYKVKVGNDQAILEITLADAAVAATPAQADAAAAAVVAAVADVRGAGSYVAWVLEKKAFGYHDVQLTVSLQRAATRLKRELEKQQGLKAPDAERSRAQAELARAAGEAQQYASLLVDAATTAQSEGTSFGKSAQMRGQALAHLPLMALDKAAMAPLRGSEAFRGALSPDHWPDAGLGADAQDFRLGADYDGDAPPRLGAVEKGGLAEALGLRPGDRVVSVDGKAVGSAWELKRLLRGLAGRTALLEVEREGKREKRKTSVPPTLR